MHNQQVNTHYNVRSIVLLHFFQNSKCNSSEPDSFSLRAKNLLHYAEKPEEIPTLNKAVYDPRKAPRYILSLLFMELKNAEGFLKMDGNAPINFTAACMENPRVKEPIPL